METVKVIETVQSSNAAYIQLYLFNDFVTEIN